MNDAQESTASETQGVEVEIFGSTFNLRGSASQEHLVRLAGMVDAKMREVADHSKTVDSTKIAVLAALNLAEELLEGRGGSGGADVGTMEKVAQLADRLESALSA